MHGLATASNPESPARKETNNPPWILGVNNPALEFQLCCDVERAISLQIPQEEGYILQEDF